MKKIFFVALFALALCVSCTEEKTVSGVMPYTKGYKIIDSYWVGSSNSDAAALMGAVQNGIADLEATYNKKWDVKFSGETEDAALASADAAALSDFDQAVTKLKDWQATFNTFKQTKDFGKGHFRMTYLYSVSRDKVLKESDTVVFEYKGI